MLRQALAIAPDHAGARSNLALLLWHTQRLDAAHAEYRHILEREPDNLHANNNLGLLLLDLNRQPEAEAAFRRVLASDPSVPEAHNNLGNALNQQARTDEAIAAYRQALALRPDYTVVKGNLAMLLLRNGRYAEGWPLYEARHDETVGEHAVKLPPVPWPRWCGEPLDGKSIIVWPEQGYGDDLQFCRYVTLLKARGAARVSVACGPALGRLFKSLEHVDAVYVLDGQGTIPRHDYWCFMMSLPLRFGTTVETIPAPMPYLRADAALAQSWRERLAGARVQGWRRLGGRAASAGSARERNRPPPLHARTRLAADPARARRALREPAKRGSDAAADPRAAGGTASARSDGRGAGFRRYGRHRRCTRSRDYRRYVDGAPRGRARQAGVDSVALRRVLALAARA